MPKMEVAVHQPVEINADHRSDPRYAHMKPGDILIRFPTSRSVAIRAFRDGDDKELSVKSLADRAETPEDREAILREAEVLRF